MRRLISVFLVCVFCYCFFAFPVLTDGVQAGDNTPPDTISYDSLPPCIDSITGEPCTEGGTGGGGDDWPIGDPGQ